MCISNIGNSFVSFSGVDDLNSNSGKLPVQNLNTKGVNKVYEKKEMPLDGKSILNRNSKVLEKEEYNQSKEDFTVWFGQLIKGYGANLELNEGVEFNYQTNFKVLLERSNIQNESGNNIWHIIAEQKQMSVVLKSIFQNLLADKEKIQDFLKFIPGSFSVQNKDAQTVWYHIANEGQIVDVLVILGLLISGSNDKKLLADSILQSLPIEDNEGDSIVLQIIKRNGQGNGFIAALERFLIK